METLILKNKIKKIYLKLFLKKLNLQRLPEPSEFNYYEDWELRFFCNKDTFTLSSLLKYVKFNDVSPYVIARFTNKNGPNIEDVAAKYKVDVKHIINFMLMEKKNKCFITNKLNKICKKK